MYKVVNLQCSWIKRLYDNNLHNWKIMSLHMITQKLGNQSKTNQSFLTIFSENFEKMEQQPINIAQYPIYNNFTSHLVH